MNTHLRPFASIVVTVAALLVGTMVYPAAAQSTGSRVDALGSEPRRTAPWRIGAFVGAAHNSPVNPALGVTPGRDHIFLGLQAQTTVLKLGAARVSYGVQVLPAVVVRGRTVPLGYYGPTDPRGFLPGSDHAYAFGLTPFALELAVPVVDRVGVFGAAAAGLLVFTRPFPLPDAQRANFTLEYGGGVLVRVGRMQWMQAGYKYHHLSNAFVAISNPGLDAHVFYVGYWRTIGRR